MPFEEKKRAREGWLADRAHARGMQELGASQYNMALSHHGMLVSHVLHAARNTNIDGAALQQMMTRKVEKSMIPLPRSRITRFSLPLWQ